MCRPACEEYCGGGNSRRVDYADSTDVGRVGRQVPHVIHSVSSSFLLAALGRGLANNSRGVVQSAAASDSSVMVGCLAA